MCGICNVVNCIRRKLFCCGDSYQGNSNCNDYCNNYRYSEPRTNVICANQRNSCFEPCCDDESTKCKHHHHDCDCGCNH